MIHVGIRRAELVVVAVTPQGLVEATGNDTDQGARVSPAAVVKAAPVAKVAVKVVVAVRVAETPAAAGSRLRPTRLRS